MLANIGYTPIPNTPSVSVLARKNTSKGCSVGVYTHMHYFNINVKTELRKCRISCGNTNREPRVNGQKVAVGLQSNFTSSFLY